MFVVLCTINKRLKDYKFSSFTFHLFYLFHLPASLLTFISFLYSSLLIIQFLDPRFYSIFFGGGGTVLVLLYLPNSLSLSPFLLLFTSPFSSFTASLLVFFCYSCCCCCCFFLFSFFNQFSILRSTLFG